MTSRLCTPLLLALLGYLAQAPSAPAAHSATGRKGMVVCVSPPAAEVGVAVLKKGGNAVDAAVAVGFALAVTWPEAGNVGGGGFMLVHPPKGQGEPTVVDYRETAPAAATKGMFAKDERLSSHKMVGVPGTVAGLALAHKKYGKLPWKDVVMPAVKLAEDGFALDAGLAAGLNAVVSRSKDYPELQRVYGKGGKPGWRAGDRLVLKDLGATLRLIADKGHDGFYKGKTADLLVAEMKRGGGLITKADLEGYTAKLRKPVHGTFRGHDVYAPPPPSAGGVCLVQMLQVLETFDRKKSGRYSADTLHLMAEAMRRAYRDRAQHLGDPDFVKIPGHLAGKDYARKLAKSINPKKATPSEELAKGIPLGEEGDSTTHFSVLDAQGMAVSNTYTLEQSYGGRVVVKGAGFLLNNEMGDFNRKPGLTTRAGLIGTPPNQIAPGKRMLSSQTPTVVSKGGKVVLVTGSPGGRTIINTVLCVVLNVIEFEMPLREAVDAPRMHHAWFPDRLQVEPALSAKHGAALRALEKMGHKLAPRPQKQGDAHSIAVDLKTGVYRGEADKRRSGAAAGY